MTEEDDPCPLLTWARTGTIARCHRRYGVDHCIKVMKEDMRTISHTLDCVGWCPMLNETIE